MRRFYADPARCAGSHIELDERESQHLSQVLRARVGEKVTILNGAGGVFECAIERIAKRAITVAVEAKKQIPSLPYQLHLYQSIPKGKVMDWIIQKATELGAATITPIITERTVVELEKEAAFSKVEKWQAIAIESIKQCGSPYLPKIDAPLPFATARKNRPSHFGLIASLHPGAREISELPLQTPCQIWIGPEGDFTPAEVDQLVTSGLSPITLGPLVLRCDTAAITTLALASQSLRTSK